MDEGFKWSVTPGQAFDELFENYTSAIFTTGGRIMLRRAAEMEQWGKDNAPWRDVTGAARAGLSAEVETNPGTIGTIRFKHGVPHGLWLEIANGGRYAIVTKVIDHFAPVVWNDIQRMMNLGLVSRE